MINELEIIVFRCLDYLRTLFSILYSMTYLYDCVINHELYFIESIPHHVHVLSLRYLCCSLQLKPLVDSSD